MAGQQLGKDGDAGTRASREHLTARVLPDSAKGMSAQVKRIYYFGAGLALGVAATRRTRRAKEAAREALKAKVTPSAIAADVADAIAELGNAVGYFAADVRQGVLNRRASYRPMIDNATGAVVLVGPEGAGPVSSSARRAGRGTPRQGQRSARRPAAPPRPRCPAAAPPGPPVRLTQSGTGTTNASPPPAGRGSFAPRARAAPEPGAAPPQLSTAVTTHHQ